MADVCGMPPSGSSSLSLCPAAAAAAVRADIARRSSRSSFRIFGARLEEELDVARSQGAVQLAKLEST